MSIKRLAGKRLNGLNGTTIAVLVVALLLAGTGARDLYAASDWEATYWNNKTLSGDPVLQRREVDLNYDWGDGSPAPTVNTDNFSARWTRTINVAAGTYRFTATMDDGLRLWVDDVLLIDSWWDSQVHSLAAEIYLNGGDHRLKVEYYDAGGKAVARLGWNQLASVPGAFYHWKGEYYNNTYFGGTPALVRDDREINFDWGTGAPAWNVVSADQFSARWTRNVYLTPGRYRFTVRADDGARLWVNNILLIDQWHDAAATNYSAEIDLPGGSIPVKMEYYEHQGGAMAYLDYLRVGDTQFSWWRGEYYDNQWMAGSPVMVRDDANINFSWGFNSPDVTVPANYFSVRWTRTMNFSAGTYRFTTSTDDGVRLWVNGRLLIDQWREQPTSTYSADIYLSGSVPIKMEYFDARDQASAWLGWSPANGTPPTPPAPQPQPPSGSAVVVDETSSGFVKGGSETAWRITYDGYGAQTTWTRNNDKVRANYNWGRWYPQLEDGRYEVYVYIPVRSNATENARYWVRHRYGYQLKVVDQLNNGGQWVSLGTYTFGGLYRGYVSLSDVTFEPYLSRIILYDAVKWEPR